jgi:hypothetical protein
MFQIKLTKEVKFEAEGHTLTAKVERISASTYFRIMALQSSIDASDHAGLFRATCEIVAQAVCDVQGIDCPWPATPEERVKLLDAAGVIFASKLSEAVTASFSEVHEGNGN